MFLAAVISCNTICYAQDGDHLSRGIQQYNAGRQTEALAELNAVVSADPHRPLAYYFAARIRLEQGELSRARQNLRLALADSTGFADAAALMAVVLDREGDSAGANQRWRQFIETAGTDPDVNATTIMMPEAYRAQLSEAATARTDAARIETERQEAARLQREREDAANREQAQREAARQEEARREADRLEQARREQALAATASDMPPAAGNTIAAEETTQADTINEEILTLETEIGEEVDELGNRVHRGIRQGLYSIISVTMLLFGGIAGIALYIRHRRKQREFSLGFAEEIDNALRERLEEESIAMELTGENAERAFNEQSSRIRQYDNEIEESTKKILEPPLPESIAPRPPYAPPQAEPVQPEPPRRDNVVEEYGHVIGDASAAAEAEEEVAWEFPREQYESPPPPLPQASERPPITEEVKSLVTRMSREGRNVNDICRAADLTRTEVELILAVRARHTENLVMDFAHDREEDADANRLYQAVRELAADGETEIGIARKLGISRTEAAMAIKVMQKRR